MQVKGSKQIFHDVGYMFIYVFQTHAIIIIAMQVYQTGLLTIMVTTMFFNFLKETKWSINRLCSTRACTTMTRVVQQDKSFKMSHIEAKSVDIWLRYYQ